MEEHNKEKKDCNCNKCEIYNLTFINPNLKNVNQRNHISSVILRNAIVNNDDPLRCIDNIYHFLYSGVFELDNKIIKEYEDYGIEKFLIDCKPVIDMVEPDKYYDKLHIYGKEVLLEYKEARKVFFKLENTDRECKYKTLEEDKDNTPRELENTDRECKYKTLEEDKDNTPRELEHIRNDVHNIRRETNDLNDTIFGFLTFGSIFIVSKYISKIIHGTL